VLVLSEEEVRSLLDIDRLIEGLASAFMEVSAGSASVPPRVTATVPHRGALGAMPGYAGRVLETKLVSVFPENDARGLPSHQALIAMFEPDTGTPLAVMDATWITAVRTAAASALATRTLATGDTAILAIVGAGVQGRAHTEIVPRGRAFSEIRLTSRTSSNAEKAARELGVSFVESIEDAVLGADVVCLCTDSAEPVIDARWLSPGAHVNSVGSNFAGGELDEAILRDGRIFVESRVAFEPPPAGAFELQGFSPSDAVELGEVLSGTRKGRTSPAQITVYKSMGHAAEDAVAAGLVYQRAMETAAGTKVEL
jgi:alanine dehydrogenase